MSLRRRGWIIEKCREALALGFFLKEFGVLPGLWRVYGMRELLNFRKGVLLCVEERFPLF